MPVELNLLGALALELIRLLRPDQLKQVQKKINELEKEHDEKKQELLQALEGDNKSKLTQLIGKHLLG